MRCVVTIIFNVSQTVERAVDLWPDPKASENARKWFEAQWVALDCEPLRNSGKVLLLDRILGVADALGYEALSQSDVGDEFTEKTALALERVRVTVDLPGQTVTY